MTKPICRHPDGCPRAARKLGWCAMHYNRLRTRGDVGPAGKLTRWGEGPIACCLEGCIDMARHADGYCDVHHQRVKKDGHPGPPTLLKRRLPKEVRTYGPGEKHRFYKYGLTPQDFERILQAQNHRCYVCGTDTPTKAGWSVDHCHESNVVRFIACNPCNAALGMIREDPRIAMRLYEVALECQQRRLGRFAELSDSR